MFEKTKQHAKNLQKQYGLDSKGQIANLSGYAVAFVVAAVMISIGSVIIANLADSSAIESGSTAENVTNAAQDGFQTFGDFMPIIAIVAAAAIVIGLLLTRFMGAGNR